MVNSTAAYVGNWHHFEYKMRHFVEVCRDGRPNEVPGEHGLMVQKILDALYASAEQGRGGGTAWAARRGRRRRRAAGEWGRRSWRRCTAAPSKGGRWGSSELLVGADFASVPSCSTMG